MKKHFNFKLMLFVLAMFASTGQMWGKIVYYNNAGNSTTPKIHFWGGNYPSAPVWASDPGMNQVGTSDIYWYEIGNNNKCIFRYNNGSDQQTGDLNVPSDYKNYYSSSAWDWYWPMTDLAPILNGTKIMVYGGVLNSWNQSNYYFMNTKSTSDVAATATKLTLSKNINNTGDSWYGATSIAGGEYYQGHWASDFKCTVEAGYAYIVRGTTSDAHFSAQCNESGENNLYKVLKAGSTTPTTSLTTTIGASTIGVGTSTLSVSTSGSAGKSVMDIDNVMYYYLHNGNTSTWSQVTLSTGNLDISALSAGHYKLATLLSDGNICVRADLDEFDVYDTWAMYSGDTKIADFTTTDGVHYSITDLVINNENNAFTNYRSSCNPSPAQAGAESLLVNEASARTLTFDNGRIAWQDGNGTFNIYIVNNGGWKIYASKTAGVEEWYWIEGNGAHTGSEAVTKQLMELTAVSGVYSCTRSLTQDQTFHFGNTIKGYGPNSTARGGNASVSVTPTSSNIGLEEYGSVYWFQFTSAAQPVVMTLNTNTDPYTISFSNPVYTITYQDQGGSAYSGSNGSALPTSHTYGTATAFVDGVKTGYTFNGWFTDESCTVSAGSSIGATAITANTTYYAKWTEKKYTVTLVNATASSVTAGIATNPTITAASKNYATFDHWEVSGGASVASTTTSPTTVSATSAGSVTAVYSQSKYVFIEGRFFAYTAPNRQTIKYTNSNSGETYWSTTSTNIQMQYDVNNDRFYLHTYATPNELKNIGGNNGFINLELSTSSSSLTDNTKYYANTNGQNLTTAGGKISFSQSSNEYRPYINNSTTDKYVVLYWDGTYLWYEVEEIQAAINNVSLSVTRVPPTAPVTATPNMYVKGAVNKAYCWGVYTDAGCTEGNKVSGIAFTSLGDGKVQFMAPQTQGTYYLKLTVRSTDACGAAIDDEHIEAFEVTTEDMVFFKNVPGWGNVHVYFLGTSSYWSSTLGSGCKGRDDGIAHGMSRIGNSDVYYYDYHGNSNVVFDGDGKAYIAFTDNYKPNSNNFSECQAVYRGDFSECAPMYVPENWITHYLNTAAYYNRGYWTTYMSASSGFSFYLWDKTANDAPGEIKIVDGAALTGTVGSNTYVYEYDFGNENNHKEELPYTYGFKIKGCGGSWYGAADDMTITKCTDWNLGTDTRKCGLSVNAPLPHKFIFTLAGDGHVQVSVEYPVNIGDYRLLYDDETQNPHPSQFIRKRANGKDTVAMYVRPSATENLKVQYCTGISGETITWADYAWNSGSAAIDVSSLEDGVYVFYLVQDEDGDLTVNTTETKPYTGLYYIRTNCLDGGWNSYKSSADNQMTYAPYPETRYGFNYYKAQWVGATGTDVTYTIACDYSPALCDTLVADEGNNPLSASEARSLPHAANIRFGWHSKTNKLKRAYINGSTNVADRFLVMIGDEKMKDKDGNALAISGLNANEISFSDLNNWIYRCDITAVEGAAVKLTANYDSHIQYFIGTSGTTEEILGGTGSKEYLMRVTYDFKTNRLMTAWLPNGNQITDDVVLKADMMLIREGQNAATQVYFNGNNHKITEVKTIFGVLEFQYDHIAGQFPSWSAPNAYKYLMYYISFPFDVKVSEIFGAGVRGENWIIQKYNGAKRAQIGWFADTPTFWETMDGSETMNKHEGYLLLLDRITFNDPSSSIWYKQSSGNSVYLYFPSSSNSIGTIDDEDKVVTVPTHTCTINRDFTIDGVAGTLNHRNTDSHWNILGTPLFETHTASTIGDPVADGAGGTTLKYFYSWNFNNNTLRPQAVLSTDTTFKSMHSYMVQYAGNVTFHGAAIKPSVAARRIPSSKNYQIELQMVNGIGEASYTYVELRENAKDTFELNEDMYMVRSSDLVDLYTFAGAYDVAANVLSENNHVVQVGMDVKQADTYRFTMPNEFSGTVTLVDSQTGVRQNLALGDYTVYLERGTYNNRISLEINIEKTTTSLEGNDVKDGKAHKFMKDGILYILKNGITYDARGNRVD